MRPILSVVLLFAAACDSSDPPTCSEAVSHFYDAGCTLITTGGSPIPEAEFLGTCREASSDVPASCEDEFEDLLEALASVPDPISGDADCDIGPELDAIATCE
jgi:hypothetical protein